MPLRSFAVLVLMLVACVAPAQPNMLTNAGFDTGDFTGWTPFANAFVEPASPPAIVPYSGTHVAKLFGNWWGVFNVSGIFQAFPAQPGDVFEIDAYSRHFSGDALIGSGAPNSNWAVMKMAFFDAGNNEIAGAEGTIMDGTFATDVWHDNAPVQGTAPAGTTSVQCLILYLQPMFDGGALQVDDVEFRQLFSMDLSQDAATNDVTAAMAGGESSAQYGRFISFDPLNGTSPGTGAFFGLHLDVASINSQVALALAMDPLYGGFHDAAGRNSITVPNVTGFTGVDVWVLGVELQTGGGYGTTNIGNLTLN